MPTVLIVVLVLLLVAGSILLVIRITAPIAARKLEDLSQEPEFNGAELTANASSFGIASQGDSPSRGLGVLGLTPTHLVFRPVAGKNAVDIERAAITSTGVTRTFMGKTHKHDLLRVAWITTEGTDESAWRLPDLATWVETLAEAHGPSTR